MLRKTVQQEKGAVTGKITVLADSFLLYEDELSKNSSSHVCSPGNKEERPKTHPAFCL